MTMLSPFAILFLIVVAVVVIKLVSGFGRISRGHAMLNCPQCGKETPANEPYCRHCATELR